MQASCEGCAVSLVVKMGGTEWTLGFPFNTSSPIPTGSFHLAQMPQVKSSVLQTAPTSDPRYPQAIHTSASLTIDAGVPMTPWVQNLLEHITELRRAVYL